MVWVELLQESVWIGTQLNVSIIRTFAPVKAYVTACTSAHKSHMANNQNLKFSADPIHNKMWE